MLRVCPWCFVSILRLKQDVLKFLGVGLIDILGKCDG